MGININMRCIEIVQLCLKELLRNLININMRCIEMNTVNAMLEAVSD